MSDSPTLVGLVPRTNGSPGRRSRGNAPRTIAFEQLLRMVVLAAGFCILVASLRAAASVLAPVMCALFVALILASPVPWLSRFMPRPLAALTVAVVASASVTALVLHVPVWADTLGTLYAQYADDLAKLPAVARAMARDYGLILPEGVEAGSWVIDASGVAVQVTAGLAATVLFVGFMLSEMWGLRRKLAIALGTGSPRLAMVANVAASIKDYFRLKTIASAATGLVVGIGCAGLGVQMPVLWGLLAFLLNYVPTIGSVVAAIPPVLLAALTLGWEHAMAVLGLYAVVNLVIGGWLEPKFVGDRIGLSPLVVLVSLVFWGWVWGTMGLLLAVPMTVAFKTILENTVELRAFAILLGSSKDLDRLYDDDGEASSDTSLAA